jgi:hypothetical protein
LSIKKLQEKMLFAFCGAIFRIKTSGGNFLVKNSPLKNDFRLPGRGKIVLFPLNFKPRGAKNAD